jgi:hypothetical protein
MRSKTKFGGAGDLPMAAFGLFFVIAGFLHFVLAVVLRIPAVSGCWTANGVPTSRIGDTAWSVCILSWGLAMVLPPPALATPWLVGVCLASFPVLIAAGLYDQHLHRRAQQRRSRTRERMSVGWFAHGRQDPFEEIESVPCAARPRSIPVFPGGLRFFRDWKTAKWVLLMLLPVLSSAGAAWVRGRAAREAVILLAVGVAASVVVFVMLCSGVSSSNWGTYSRRREPVRYWVDVGLFGLAYIGLCLAGYWM